MNMTKEREKLRHYLSPTEMGEQNLDARYSVPDIDLECRRTVEDLILGCRPTTALGVLLKKRQELAAKFFWHGSAEEMPDHVQRLSAVEEHTVTGLISAYHPQVQWVLEDLTENGYVERIEEGEPKMTFYMAKVTLDRLAPLPNPYPAGPKL